MTNRRNSDKKQKRAKPAMANGPVRLSPQPAPAASSANQGDAAGTPGSEIDEPHDAGLAEPKKSIGSERRGKVVLTIVVLALIWIAVVAYYVAQMPPQ
jgi:hypothetical protein